VNYTVIWPDAAQDQLADQYLVARLDGLEAEFSQSVSEIDARLARDAVGVGESRPGSQRILIDLPAMVTYRVDEPNRVATITEVKYVS
jgi:hypothetical protein